MQQTQDVIAALQSRIRFVRECFNDPDTLPATLYAALIGSTVYTGPEDISRILSRQQDPSKLWEAGHDGLPAWSIYGSEDKYVNNEETNAILSQHFRDFEAYRIEGGSHTVFYEHQDMFVKSLMRFAKRVQGCH